MPRYFFHISDGRFIRDDEGTVLPNVATARREAIRMAGTLLHDEDDETWPDGRWDVTVTDGGGQTQFILSVRIRTPDDPADAPG